MRPVGAPTVDGVGDRGDLRGLAVLGAQLGGGRDLQLGQLGQRALREGRELAQRLDLDVEEVDADRVVGGRRVDVEDPTADRELAAVVDLVDALVAGGDEVGGDLVEVEQVADAQPERLRAQRRVRDLLAQRDGGDDDDRRLGVGALVGQQRVERGDAQADEVRRRREVRLVGNAAARVEAHRPGREPVAQVGGEVARLAVVGRDDQRGPSGHRTVEAVEQRADDVRAVGGGDERAATVAREARAVGVVGEMGEEGAKRHVGHAQRPRGGRGRVHLPI